MSLSKSNSLFIQTFTQPIIVYKLFCDIFFIFLYPLILRLYLSWILDLNILSSPGIGSGSAPLEQCIELAQRPSVLQHWTSCRHLIIDEVSMVEAHFFDKLESVAR